MDHYRRRVPVGLALERPIGYSTMMITMNRSVCLLLSIAALIASHMPPVSILGAPERSPAAVSLASVPRSPAVSASWPAAAAECRGVTPPAFSACSANCRSISHLVRSTRLWGSERTTARR
jgi:hypothetical protein